MHRRTDLSRNGRAAPDHIHEVMFAVQLLNMDRLESRLLDVSNPSSPNYGDYMTKAQVTEMTSNPIANKRIKEYLKMSGASIISETHGGEYISATGPVKLWEGMFNTEFFVFHHKRIGSAKIEVVRAEKYSVPLILNDYVASVFHTIQMPLHISTPPMMTPVDPSYYLSPIPVATPIVDDDLIEFNRTLINVNSEFKDRLITEMHTSGRPGYITPSILRSTYNIDESLGSDESTQGLYETLTQSYSPSDLLKFQKQYGVSQSGIVTSIGNHSSDATCLNDGYNCIEGNLDIQYMMAIAQNAPTTYWWIDPSYSFGGWLKQVSNMINPPLVFSIRYV